MAYLEIGCGVLLAVVFGWSAAGKLRSPAAFGEFARSLAPLVRRYTPAAVLLTAAEVALAPLVLVAPAWGFGLACVLLAVLAAGVLVVVRRRLAVRCRCFGAGGGQLGVRHAVRNLVLLAVGAAGLAATVAGPAGSTAVGALLAAGAAVVLATLVNHLDDVVELFA